MGTKSWGSISCTYAVLLNCSDRRFFGIWVLGQSQVVGWGVVDPKVSALAVVFSKDLSGRPSEHDSVIEYELQFFELLNVAGKDIKPLDEFLALLLVEVGDARSLRDHFDI